MLFLLLLSLLFYCVCVSLLNINKVNFQRKKIVKLTVLAVKSLHKEKYYSKVTFHLCVWVCVCVCVSVTSIFLATKTQSGRIISKKNKKKVPAFSSMCQSILLLMDNVCVKKTTQTTHTLSWLRSLIHT